MRYDVGASVNTCVRIKYTKELLEPLVKGSKCWREVVHKLSPDLNYRGSESHAKYVAIKYHIDFSHFTGSAWNKGRIFGPKRPLQDYFDGIWIKTNILKNRLIQEGYKQAVCEKCGQTTWRGVSIPLELHHIDCNPKNNKLENLMIVCCNCHAIEHYLINQQKPKKPRKKYIDKRVYIPRVHRTRTRRTKILNQCLICGKPAENKYCSYSCAQKASRKVKRPSREELAKMVWEKSCVQITKELGLKSSTSIAKWCKEYGITKPTVGYWEKRYHNPPVVNLEKQTDSI